MKANTTATNSNSAVLKFAHQLRKEKGITLKEAFTLAYKQSTNIVPAPKAQPKQVPAELPLVDRTHWTRADIDAIFSRKVAKLVSNGYTIYTKTMAGSQGEIAKLDFVNNGYVYRLLMEDEHSILDENGDICYYNDHISIRFGFAGRVEDFKGWDPTIWNNKIEVLWSINCYKLSDNYYVPKDLAKQAHERRVWRADNRPYTRYNHSNKVSTLTTPSELKAALKLVRTRQGYKNTKPSDITNVERHSGDDHRGSYYLITAKGKNLFFYMSKGC